jgi:signal transduction histidine kinase
MNIRTRLTLTFFTIVIVIVSVISASIYYFSAQYRERDFFRRLKNRAINTAKLLILYEEVDASLLQRMEQDNPANLPDQHVVVFSYKNEILFNSGPSVQIDTTLLNRIRLEGEIQSIEGDKQTLGFLFTEKYDRFTVIASAIDTNGLDALANLRSVLLVTFASSVLIVSVLGWFFSGRALKPISNIVAEVDNITEANLELRLDEGNGKDELSKLAATFNKMLARLQKAFVAQRSFIANASHELNTPLTVMSGKIEVALLTKRTEDYYKTTLIGVLSTIKALSKLSRQLLLLAQTSSGLHGREFSKFNIDDVLWSVKEELLKVHPNYVIDIRFDTTAIDHDLTVTGDVELLRVVIHNLMENACKYSEDTTVTITLTSDKHHVRIDFVNRTKNLPPEDYEKIFEPFYRGRTPNPIEGSGIGLSLIKRILDLHNGSIVVEGILEQSVRFRLELDH